MSGALLPIYRWQVFQDGQPAAGALLSTYLSGTSTPQPVYSDPDLDVSHALSNPVEADADGVFPTMYLAAVNYRMTVTDADGNTIFPAQDNIFDFAQINAGTSTMDMTGLAGENLTANLSVYLSDGSGGKIAGRWYLGDSANTYSSSIAGLAGIVLESVSTGDTATIRIAGEVTGFSSLTVGGQYFIGSSGALTVTQPTNWRVIGVAKSSTVLVVSANPAQLTASAPITSITATVANVQNTTSPTTILSFSSVSMANGDVISIQLAFLLKNNKGSGGTITLDWNYGGATVTLANVPAPPNSATEFKGTIAYALQRVGSDLWIYESGLAMTYWQNWAIAANAVSVISAPTFTSPQTVTLVATLSAADATFYVKPQTVLVQHLKAG